MPWNRMKVLLQVSAYNVNNECTVLRSYKVRSYTVNRWMYPGYLSICIYISQWGIESAIQCGGAVSTNLILFHSLQTRPYFWTVQHQGFGTVGVSNIRADMNSSAVQPFGNERKITDHFSVGWIWDIQYRYQVYGHPSGNTSVHTACQHACSAAI